MPFIYLTWFLNNYIDVLEIQERFMIKFDDKTLIFSGHFLPMFNEIISFNMNFEGIDLRTELIFTEIKDNSNMAYDMIFENNVLKISFKNISKNSRMRTKNKYSLLENNTRTKFLSLSAYCFFDFECGEVIINFFESSNE